MITLTDFLLLLITFSIANNFLCIQIERDLFNVAGKSASVLSHQKLRQFTSMMPYEKHFYDMKLGCKIDTQGLAEVLLLSYRALVLCLK